MPETVNETRVCLALQAKDHGGKALDRETGRQASLAALMAKILDPGTARNSYCADARLEDPDNGAHTPSVQFPVRFELEQKARAGLTAEPDRPRRSLRGDDAWNACGRCAAADLVGDTDGGNSAGKERLQRHLHQSFGGQGRQAHRREQPERFQQDLHWEMRRP
jgi:hypothetical protein